MVRVDNAREVTNRWRKPEAIEVHRKSVENYKRRFAEMSEEERAFLIAKLYDERWRELVRGGLR